jgi:hypothetical protein
MRPFLNVLFATAACVQCAVVSAQAPSQRAVIMLGMTGSEVRKALGTPLVYHLSDPTRDVPSSRVGVLPPSSEYTDAYEIKTALNTYELWTIYSMDDSESRLHPIPRIVAVYFELDKRTDINDVGKVLDDIPEAAALCGAECTIAEVSFTGYSALNLHPRTISPTQQAEADLIGSFFGKSDRRPVKPTVKVIVERGAIIKVILDEDEDPLEGPVKGTWRPQRPGN